MSEVKKSQLSPFAVLPEDFQDAIRLVGEKVKFPVGSKKEFVAQLGGEDAIFPFRNRKAPVGELIAFMPSYLFPLSSLENLAEKTSELYSQRQPRPMRPLTVTEFKERIDHIFSQESEMIDELLRLIWRLRPENLNR